MTNQKNRFLYVEKLKINKKNTFQSRRSLPVIHWNFTRKPEEVMKKTNLNLRPMAQNTELCIKLKSVQNQRFCEQKSTIGHALKR